MSRCLLGVGLRLTQRYAASAASVLKRSAGLRQTAFLFPHKSSSLAPLFRAGLHSTAFRLEDALHSGVKMENIFDIGGKKPLIKLSEGQEMSVEMSVGSKSSTSTYTIRQISNDHYSCTCMAWKMKKGVPVDARTCKHLEEALGKDYEAARIASKGFAAVSKTKKRKKGEDEEPASPVKKTPTSSKRAKASVDVLLAQTYKLDKMTPDCTNFWISEKLDGIRFFYDGKGQMFSRLGNEFTPPKEYMDSLPKGDTLDGELFVSRNAFSETSSIVRSHSSNHWSKVTMMIFDVPSKGNLPFEKRLEYLRGLFPDAPLHKAGAKISASDKASVTLLDQIPCKGPDHLHEVLAKVQNVGGEGLMLRQKGSQYETKRSSTLQKVKTFYDAEAEVVGYESGKKMTGALTCRMANGKQFSLGSGLTDEQRRKPPSIGSIVNYRFQELSKDGVPRFGTFVGEAIDKDKTKDADIRTVNKAESDNES